MDLKEELYSKDIKVAFKATVTANPSHDSMLVVAIRCVLKGIVWECSNAVYRELMDYCHFYKDWRR